MVKGLQPEVNTGRGDALHRRLPRGLGAARLHGSQDPASLGGPCSPTLKRALWVGYRLIDILVAKPARSGRWVVFAAWEVPAMI
jgi:hypothetical protein